MKQCIFRIKYAAAFLTVIFMIICVSVNIFAYDGNTGGQIIGKYDLEGVVFSLYRIGNMNELNEIVPLAEYADYQIDYSDKYAPQTLEAYIQRDQLNSAMQTKTNQNGVFQFYDITEGIYLITGDSTQNNDNIYFPSPVIVAVSDDSPITEMIIKSTIEPVKSQKNISVLKVWDDNHSEKRPFQISVDLLRDGKIYDTVQLSQNNNWQYQWKELDGSCKWYVAEKNVPQDYTVNISANDSGFVITNTVSETITPPSTPEKLPQTGQINLPVIILLPIGLVLVIIGIVRRKHSV